MASSPRPSCPPKVNHPQVPPSAHFPDLSVISLAFLTLQLTKFHVDFLIIGLIFYIVVAAAHLNLGSLRTDGWLFDMGNSADESWYEFYKYYGEFQLSKTISLH